MWLFSGALGDPEDEIVMEVHSPDALYSAVKGLMHAIQAEDQDAQQDAAHQMIQIVKTCMIRRWSESKLGNGKTLVQIPKKNTHLVDLKWTEAKSVRLKTLVER
jgi:hypothetical protein